MGVGPKPLNPLLNPYGGGDVYPGEIKERHKYAKKITKKKKSLKITHNIPQYPTPKTPKQMTYRK